MVTSLSHRFTDAKAANNTWDDLWQEGTTPWDRQRSSPALQELIENESLILFEGKSARRAIIPACGRGYDVVYLAETLPAKYGFVEVLGLDISSTAVKAAEAYVASTGTTSPAKIVEGDFFDETLPDLRKKFSLIYDYTFLCALHPSERTKWASRMANLLVEDGILIALQCIILRDYKADS